MMLEMRLALVIRVGVVWEFRKLWLAIEVGGGVFGIEEIFILIKDCNGRHDFQLKTVSFDSI